MRWEWAQWFKKRWWKRYLKSHTVQGYLDWKKSYWINFIDQIEVSIEPKARVLDVGCGPAGIFNITEEHETVACDPLLPYYESNLDHFSKEKYKHLKFVSTPFESTSWIYEFDITFCLNVINHVKDFDGALKRLVEATKPNGKIVISIDCHNFLFPKWLLRIVPIDILHPHQYDLSEYLSKFKSHGLKIDKKTLIKTGFYFNYYAVVCTKI